MDINRDYCRINRSKLKFNSMPISLEDALADVIHFDGSAWCCLATSTTYPITARFVAEYEDVTPADSEDENE